MGTLTLGDGTTNFRTELNWVLKDRADTGWTDTRRDRAINWAYRHVCHPSIHRFSELQASHTITLVTGDNDYALDATTVTFNIVAVRAVIYYQATSITPTATKRTLTNEDIRYFFERRLSSGQPVVYAVDGEQLFISGVPRTNENGQLLQVHSWREPAALASDSQVTVLTDYWDDVILKGAQAKAELDLGYRDLGKESLEDFEAMINTVGDEFDIGAESETGFRGGFELHGAELP